MKNDDRSSVNLRRCWTYGFLAYLHCVNPSVAGEAYFIGPDTTGIYRAIKATVSDAAVAGAGDLYRMTSKSAFSFAGSAGKAFSGTWSSPTARTVLGWGGKVASAGFAAGLSLASPPAFAWGALIATALYVGGYAVYYYWDLTKVTAPHTVGHTSCNTQVAVIYTYPDGSGRTVSASTLAVPCVTVYADGAWSAYLDGPTSPEGNRNDGTYVLNTAVFITGREYQGYTAGYKSPVSLVQCLNPSNPCANHF